MTDHGEQGAFTALRVGEAGHGPGAAAVFAEGALDHVGGATYFITAGPTRASIRWALSERSATSLA